MSVGYAGEARTEGGIGVVRDRTGGVASAWILVGKRRTDADSEYNGTGVDFSVNGFSQAADGAVESFNFQGTQPNHSS